MAKNNSNPFRINVISSDLPAWANLTQIPLGTFREVGLNTPDDARPSFYPANSTKATFANWTSAAFISEFSAYGGIAHYGGGEHGDGNPSYSMVVVWNCETRLFEVKNANPNPHIQATGKATDPDPTDTWGHFVSDNMVPAPHTYNALCERPASMGGGPRGSLAFVGGAPGDSTANLGYSWSSMTSFDLSQATMGHTRHGGNFYYTPNQKTFGDYIGACIDRVNKGWWSFGGGGGSGARIQFMSVNGGDAIPVKEGPITYAPGCSLHHFENQNVLSMFYNFNADNFFNLYLVSSGPTLGNPIGIPLKDVGGPRPTLDNNGTPALGNDGPRWSTLGKRFVWMDGRKLVPEIWSMVPSDPNNLMTSTWKFESEVVTPADSSVITPYTSYTDESSYNGCLGKLLEVPKLQALYWTRSHLAKAQLIRPSWMPV